MAGTWQRPGRVIVTGGTGFLGSYICRRLAEAGQEVVAFGIEPFSPETRFVLGDEAGRISYVACDICDAAAMAKRVAESGAQAIVHVAGYVGHEASMVDPARTYAVNVGGTVNTLEAARHAGTAKVLIVSSNAAYHTKERPAFDEGHPVTSIRAGNPNAHYGASKMAGEQIGLAYHSFHEMEVLAARITGVYGFGMRGAIFVKTLVEGAVRGERVAIPSGGAVARDYTYVEDTAAALVAMLNTDTRALDQRVYNFSRGELVRADEMARLVREIVPGADVGVGAPLSPLEAANVDQRAPLDSSAALRIFGLSCRYAPADGIRDYAAVMKRFLESHPR